MRELRLVGPGADRDHVVAETLDGAEQFSLRVDDLRRFVPEEETHPQAAASMQIPPREIQRRVRAGEQPNALAEEAGVSVDRVLLFAAPVLDERSRMAGEARRARARRSTPEGQLVNFGETVDERFSAHGIDPASVQWDALRRDDGQWVVCAGWRGGDAERCAEWSFSLASRAVTPLDETAADLLSDRPIRPVVSAVPDRPQAPPMSGADAITGPLPLTVDRPAAGDEELFDAPETRPLRVVEETDEQKAARARIPSWDDILLGVRRKRD
jgi:Protein of unknown function (DUF3071)